MYKSYETSFRGHKLNFGDKFCGISFSYVLLICILASIGIIMLYSAANGSWRPWALAQMIRLGLGFGVMFFMAFIDIKVFLSDNKLYCFLN